MYRLAKKHWFESKFSRIASHCGPIRSNPKKCNQMKSWSREIWRTLCSLDIIYGTNKKSEPRHPMEVNFATLGRSRSVTEKESDFWSKRVVSGFERFSPNLSLKWICSFVSRGCLGIIGLENTNRNHLSAKINCLDVQTLPYSTIYWDLVGILDVSPFHRSFKLP